MKGLNSFPKGLFRSFFRKKVLFRCYKSNHPSLYRQKATKMSTLTLIHTFTHERERLRSLARRFVGNDNDAEDALQDAFIKLWPRAEKIDNEQYCNALATTTVKNLSIDRQRSRRTQTTSLNEELTIADSPTYDDREELIRDVETIINEELSETQRRIIHLRDYEEKEYDEIANELGLQPTAVRMQLSRARRRIREIYKERKQ